MTTRKEFVADVLARIGALAIDHEVRRLGGFDAPALTEHPALNHVEVAILLRSAEAVADGLDTAGLLEDEEPRGFHPELREDAAVDEAGQNIRHKEAYVEGLRNRFGESMAPFLNAGGMSACIQKFRESFVAGTVEHVVGLFLEHLEAEVFHLALRADVLQEERAAARGTVSSLRHEVQGLLRAAEVNRNRLADAEAAVSALEDAIDAHRGARRAEDDGSLDTAAAADLALYAVLEAGEAKAAVSLAGVRWIPERMDGRVRRPEGRYDGERAMKDAIDHKWAVEEKPEGDLWDAVSFHRTRRLAVLERPDPHDPETGWRARVRKWIRAPKCDPHDLADAAEALVAYCEEVARNSYAEHLETGEKVWDDGVWDNANPEEFHLVNQLRALIRKARAG